MELIAIPIFLILIFMWVPGLRLAVEAARTGQDKLRTSVIIGACASGVFVISLGVPLIVLREEPVNWWMLLMWMTLEYLVVAIVAFTLVYAFRDNGRRPLLITASVLFIAAGAYPVAWFTVVRPLVKLLGVEMTG